MLGLVMNQERDEAKMAATQNSPPLDLLGEIWGGGLALLQEERGTTMRQIYNCTTESRVSKVLHAMFNHFNMSCETNVKHKLLCIYWFQHFNQEGQNGG